MGEAIEKKEDDSKKSGRLILKWIIIGVVVLAVAGGGFFGWTMFMNGKTEQSPKTEGLEKTKKKTDAVNTCSQMFPMDIFVVNLSDRGGSIYLKTKIELEFVKQELKEELSAKLPQLRDMILLFLSTKTRDEIHAIEGKFELKHELIKRSNQILKKGKIKNLYFTEFIIQ